MKLITLDLDGTLLPQDTAFAAVLRENGYAKEVAASDEAYFAGDLSLEACFWQQWGWVRSLSLADMHRALGKAPWLADIGPAVQALRASARVVLLTDQPSVLCDYLGRWGLIDAICSPVKVKEGACVDIDARFDKWGNLKDRLATWGTAPEQVTHVGNGSNDVPVWQHVGRSVAMFAEPDVARHADLDLGQPSSLMALVDALG